MLVNDVGENYSACWRKVFLLAILMMVKDVGEKCMLVKSFTIMQLLFAYLRISYFDENHQNQIFYL